MEQETNSAEHLSLNLLVQLPADRNKREIFWSILSPVKLQIMNYCLLPVVTLLSNGILHITLCHPKFTEHISSPLCWTIMCFAPYHSVSVFPFNTRISQSWIECPHFACQKHYSCLGGLDRAAGVGQRNTIRNQAALSKSKQGIQKRIRLSSLDEPRWQSQLESFALILTVKQFNALLESASRTCGKQYIILPRLILICKNHLENVALRHQSIGQYVDI